MRPASSSLPRSSRPRELVPCGLRGTGALAAAVVARRARVGRGRASSHGTVVGRRSIRVGARGGPVLLGRDGSVVLRLFGARAASVALGGRAYPAYERGHRARAPGDPAREHSRRGHSVVAGSRRDLCRERMGHRRARSPAWRRAPPRDDPVPGVSPHLPGVVGAGRVQRALGARAYRSPPWISAPNAMDGAFAQRARSVTTRSTGSSTRGSLK